MPLKKGFEALSKKLEEQLSSKTSLNGLIKVDEFVLKNNHFEFHEIDHFSISKNVDGIRS